MLSNLLFYRVCIFNTLGLVGLLAAYWYGLVDNLLEHDAVGVIYVIGGLLVIGIFGSLGRSWKVSQAINTSKIKGIARHSFVKDARKMAHKNEYINSMSVQAVLIGLFGNVFGLIMALGSPESVAAGASVAFGSTAAGILVALWLDTNFLMLKTATANLIEDVS